GVLQRGPLRFPQKRRALAKLAEGPVIRVAMRFHRAFWEKRAPGAAFFHAPQAPFPTFWTPLPMHAPLLTAWAGGPKAARLTGSSTRKLIDAALASVESMFGKGPRALLAAAYVQDWMHDAYSRGGYSYVLVGGVRSIASSLPEARILVSCLVLIGFTTRSLSRVWMPTIMPSYTGSPGLTNMRPRSCSFHSA